MGDSNIHKLFSGVVAVSGCRQALAILGLLQMAIGQMKRKLPALDYFAWPATN